jgi:hypothetical protein
MTVLDGDFCIFHPTSRPEQVWILTQQWVTVHNMLDGSTATVSYIRFNTELMKWKTQ